MNGVNFFDIVTLLVGLWAVIAGWRRGAILQLGSLLGILLSLYLASRYGVELGTMLHLSKGWVAPGGFILMALLTLIAVALLGHLLRRLFHFAGLGVLDILIGIVLSLAKWLLLLSALYTAFGAVNHTLGLVEKQSLNSSRTFYPVCRVADYVLPFVTEAMDEAGIDEWLPKADKPDAR